MQEGSFGTKFESSSDRLLWTAFEQAGYTLTCLER